MSRYTRKGITPRHPPQGMKTRATHLDPAEDYSFVPYLEVDDAKWVDTGLLWEDGTAVWRAPEPLGFGKREGLIEG